MRVLCPLCLLGHPTEWKGVFGLFKFSFKNLPSLPFVTLRRRCHVHLLLVHPAQPSFFVTLPCVARSLQASAAFPGSDLGAASVSRIVSFLSSLRFERSVAALLCSARGRRAHAVSCVGFDLCFSTVRHVKFVLLSFQEEHGRQLF